MDVRTSLQRYLRHHKAAGSSPHTVSAYTRWVGQFAAYLEGQHHSGDIEALTADDLRGWLDELREAGAPNPQQPRRPNSDQTVRSKVIHIKAWAHWLLAEGYLDRDPFLRVAIPKADEAAKTTLTPPEIETLLRACNPRSVTGRRDAAIILLMYSTGIRRAEVVGIQTSDVEHDAEQITIRRGKGGKFRIVPLSPKVERAIDRYLDHPKRRKVADWYGALFRTQTGEPFTAMGIALAFRRLEAKTGIRCNPHKWRHSSAVQYLRGGGRLELLQRLLGHATLEMTLHYARMAGVDVKKAHETADPTNGIKYRP